MRRSLSGGLLLLVGISLGWAAKSAGANVGLWQGKSAEEAGKALLVEAERLAGDGSWERIAVGRIYYLSGDKARGQSIFDSVINSKPQGSDWKRIGEVYAEAGENDKAEAAFAKLLALEPKDDTSQSEVGAWYLRQGKRDKAEELFKKAMDKNPEELWHYTRAAEAYLKVPRGR